jgi:hypothetical protein
MPKNPTRKTPPRFSLRAGNCKASTPVDSSPPAAHRRPRFHFHLAEGGGGGTDCKRSFLGAPSIIKSEATLERQVVWLL